MTESTDTRKPGGGERRSTPTDDNTGVAAASDIPVQVTAGPYPEDFNLRFRVNTVVDYHMDFLLEVKYKNGTICLEIESANQLLGNVKTANPWLRYVQPARDRHEQNCEFYRQENGQIFLQTLKKLESGEQLLAWYSDQLCRDLAIPFLGLHNIIGNQQYVCDSCGQTYTHPNPLKLHLRTCRDKHSTPTSNTHTMLDRDILFRPYLRCSCPSTSKPERRRVSEYSTTAGASYDHHQPFSNHHVLSAFRPLHLTSSGNHGHRIATIPSEDSIPVNLSMKDIQAKTKIPTFENRFPQPIQIFNHIQPQVFPFPLGTLTPASYKCCDVWNPYSSLLSSQHPSQWTTRHAEERKERFATNNLEKHRHNQTSIKLPAPVPTESDGEPLDLLPKSFFANKSKKGHYCIYCGKLYSRKYGLKIHLRTHTGYKPLKCKVCLRPFGDPSNLNKHIRLHAQGETPYRCEFCGKVLVRRRDLERHIKSRHPRDTGRDFVRMAREATNTVDHNTDRQNTNQNITVV